MLTSKQRASLRAQANGLSAVTQIGKGGITEAVIKSLDITIENRELIKVSVLETAGVSAKEAVEEIAVALKAEPISAVGSKIVLYRKAKKDPKITY